MDGGGGTASAIGLPRLPLAMREKAVCSAVGNLGAGATTAKGPMLMSPILRIAACTTGGGPTIDALGIWITRFEEPNPVSSAGATAEA